MRWGPTVTDPSSTNLSTPISRRTALLGAAGVAAGLAVGSGSDAFAATTKARAKKGGNLRIGVPGNGVKDIIDGQNILTKADQARQQAGWETLLTFDRDYKLQSDGLAESVEASGKLAYTIRLRKGLEFHNGKSVTADDVIYSLKRLTTKKLALDGGTGVTSVDPTKLKKMDNLTVRVGLLQPDSTIPFGLASYTAGIVPVGYTSKGTSVKTGQIGTGAFMLESFDPGKQSVHTRFANYWRGGGLPYLDQVTVIDLDDDTARINALISGQIDVMTDVPFAETKLITGQSSLVLFENAGAGWLPLCMRIDQKPFTDVRVRQAFRLIVDRPAMLEQAIAGHGRIANDLYSAFDPAFLKLPQRTQDIEKAKSLLKAAGQEKLTIDLPTNEQAAGMNEMCKVFAQQAKAAGVTVNVKVLDSTTFNNGYLKWTFSPDFWGTRFYLPQVAQGSLAGAPFNETHWPPKGSKFASWYQQALASGNAAARTEIEHKMMHMEFESGAYIIPFNNNLVDAYSKKVTGFQKNRGTLNLDSFGRNYTEVSFT
jgi:peptide/nickel transport system substrate-binding protein